MKIQLVPILMGFLLGAACVHAHENPETFQYAEADGVDPKHLSLDVYKPPSPGGGQTLIYVHGGGWRGGDKANVGKKAQYFTEKGWLFISANYRLLPHGKHPANAQDVAQAVAWVHGHAKDHGGDPNRIFLMGHSAGAHLVSLVATNSELLQKAGKDLSIIKGVISLDTNTYDIPRLMRSKASRFYSQVFGTNQTLWKDAAPYHHVAKDKDIPPFFIAYSRGTTPKLDPARPLQANAFGGRLRNSGIPTKVFKAIDRNHGEISQRFGDPADNVTLNAYEFLVLKESWN